MPILWSLGYNFDEILYLRVQFWYISIRGYNFGKKLIWGYESSKRRLRTTNLYDQIKKNLKMITLRNSHWNNIIFCIGKGSTGQIITAQQKRGRHKKLQLVDTCRLIRVNLIRAIAIFFFDQSFWPKKCWPIAIRAVTIRSVDPFSQI